MVRAGRVLSAPHFVTKEGPGTAIEPDLVRRWSGFDLAGALGSDFETRLRRIYERARTVEEIEGELRKLREEMEETRTALSEKLETLEEKVVGIADTATTAVAGAVLAPASTAPDQDQRR